MKNDAKRMFKQEHLHAIEQIKQCLKVKQQSAMSGDKQEYRRALDVIDVIATRHSFSSAMINAISTAGERAV
ncbi:MULTISPECIES: hypothetical protein [unclassified Pseudomonas]|uniref:hypothetical protein n=1 Tax=unclassified Pseudomonas TaxID=196821 RepID=UPI0020973B74|nr:MULTISPECIES: hypothetical protein [unclassified Pseudomonas]MCO7506773.1 hypothetical protein [Pseudomonas sp. VE 267-6A]MCO7531483.1 hypothetical protein [Pseudomonas sp. 2]